MTRLCEKRPIHRFSHSRTASLCVKNPPIPPKSVLTERSVREDEKSFFTHSPQEGPSTRGSVPGLGVGTTPPPPFLMAAGTVGRRVFVCCA